MSKKNRKAAKSAKQSESVSHASLTRTWVIALILGITFLSFARSLWNDFAYDDKTFILENQIIRSKDAAEVLSNIPKVFTHELWFYRVMQDKDPNKNEGPTTPYYRPVFTIFQMLCWQLFGTWAAGWHLINIIVHLLVVYFAFLIFERITGNLKMSAIGALIFAIHPLRVESVAWICGISDPYLALLLLPSFYFYMRYRESGIRKDLVKSLGLFLLAAFTKEPAVAMPIFILAYELFIFNQEKPLKEKLRPAIIYSAAFFLIAGTYFLMRFYALGFIFGDSNFVHHTPQEVLLTIPLVIWKYIGLILAGFIALPIDLLNSAGIAVERVNFSIFHGTPMVDSFLSIRFILPAIGLAALAAALWPLRNSLVSRFAILWFFIQLLPVLNLNAFSVDFLVQERYVYIPSIGFSLLLAQGIVGLAKERRFEIGNRRLAEAALLVLIVICLSGKSFAQNEMWKDDQTLWAKGIEAAPDQTMPYYVLGHKYVSQRRFDKAIEQFEKYMQLDSKNVLVLNNLAASHVYMYELELRTNPNTADSSRLDRAIALCEAGLKIKRFSALYDTLGLVYTFRKEYWMAQARFDQGLALEPDNAMIIYHKGATYLKESRVDDALRYLEPARQISPDLPDTYESLGYAYMVKGMRQEAINSFTEFLRLQPYSFNRDKISQYIKDLNAQLQSSPPKG